ncbi:MULTISPECIES: hypothetical protein [unclassified Lysinibacillus]
MRMPALPKDKPASKRTSAIHRLKETLSKLKRKSLFVKVPERK